MNTPLRLLVIDDAEDDALLIVHTLQRGGYAPLWKRVDTAATLAAALEQQAWDTVICDWVMPQFSAPAALELLAAHRIDVPIIVVSGEVGEEMAVSAMKAGAHDFISKDQLTRLCPAIARELSEANERRARTRAEEDLHHSEERYRRLIENLNDVVFSTDVQGNLTYVSPVIERESGYRVEQLIGQHFSNFLHPDDRPDAAARWQRLVGGQPESFECRAFDTDGHGRDVHISSHPQIEHGVVIGISSVLTDITERKHAAEEFAQSVARFRTLFETEPECVKLLDRQGHVVEMNPAGLAMIEADSLEKVRGRGMAELVVARDRPAFTALTQRVFGGESGTLAFEVVGFKCTRRWLETHAAPLRDTAGRITSLVGVTRDITAHKRAAEQIALQGTALTAAANAIVITERDGRIVWVNPAFTRLTGYTSDEAIGDNPRILKSGHHDPAFYQALWATLSSGQVWTGELVNRRKDGSLYSEEMTITPMHQNGVLTHYIAIKQDISERKRAEGNRRTLLQLATGIAGTLDLDTLLAEAQRRTAEALPCDSVVTLSPDSPGAALRIISHYGIPPDLLSAALALRFRPSDWLTGDLKTGQPLVINDPSAAHLPGELIAQYPFGPIMAIALQIHGRSLGRLCAMRTPGGRPFTPDDLELFTGITQQVAIGIETVRLYHARAEEAQVSGALARLGQELIATMSTPELLDRLCQVSAEILGGDICHTVLRHPEEHVWVPVAGYGDPPGHRDVIRELKLPEVPIAAVVEQLDRNGFVHLNIAELASVYSPLATLTREIGITTFLCIALRRGPDLVGVQTVGYRDYPDTNRSQHERIARGIGQLASLALETKRLLEDLERANRLKSDFMATMSHELRTPLNIIMGYNGILLDEGPGPLVPEQTEMLRRTQHSAQELLELINSTLDIGRLEAGRSPVDIKEVNLAALLRTLEADIRERHTNPNVSLVCNIAAELPGVRSDAAKLRLVIKNLIDNALKFTERGMVAVHAGIHGAGVEVCVADTGMGIPAELLPSIFEPFRQGEGSATHGHGGVGLGLYIVRQLLALLGGTITVDSTIGRGSTFRVWLPLHPRTAEGARTAEGE